MRPGHKPTRAAVLPPTGACLADTPQWGFALAAALMGLVAGWGAIHVSDALHLRLSTVHIAVLATALVVVVPVLRRPVAGLAALVLVVYLNLSDVLMRHHGFPSLLQLLLIPLLATALIDGRGNTLKRLAPRPLVIALAAYVLVFFASSTVAEHPALADARTIAGVKGFAIFILVLTLASTPGRVRAAVWSLVAGGLLLAGISLVQVAADAYGNDVGGLARVDYGQIYADVRLPRLAGPVGDPNFFGQILVIVVPPALLLALRERTLRLRLLALCAAAATTTAIVFTYSRGTALALVAVLVCALFAARPGPRRLGAGAALVLVGLLLLPGAFSRRLVTLQQFVQGETPSLRLDSSLENRLLWARVAWRQFLDHPMLGVGAGNYTVRYDPYAGEVGSAAPEYDKAGGPHYPHSLYLELAAETGFPGIVVFGTVVLLVFGYLRRAETAYFAAGEPLYAALASALSIALLGYLLSALFLHGHFQRYLWILLGLSAALAARAPVATANRARAASHPTALHSEVHA